MSTRVQGFVKWFEVKKGYGFIIAEGYEDLFVHFSNIEMSGFRKLDIGDEVEFKIQESKEGKGSEAIHVIILSKDKKY
ncbi:MAG: cold shock domain-containing protein [Candidatus Thorarchaeota archaeon]